MQQHSAQHAMQHVMQPCRKVALLVLLVAQAFHQYNPWRAD
jgi:hypothetical protein